MRRCRLWPCLLLIAGAACTDPDASEGTNAHLDPTFGSSPPVEIVPTRVRPPRADGELPVRGLDRHDPTPTFADYLAGVTTIVHARVGSTRAETLHDERGVAYVETVVDAEVIATLRGDASSRITFRAAGGVGDGIAVHVGRPLPRPGDEVVVAHAGAAPDDIEPWWGVVHNGTVHHRRGKLDWPAFSQLAKEVQ